MTESGDQLDLAQKSIATEHAGDGGQHDLYRDVAVVLDVARQIHGCHSTAAELSRYGITFGKCVREASLTLEQLGESLRRRHAEQRGLSLTFREQRIELRSTHRVAGAQLFDERATLVRGRVEELIDQ